MEYFTEIEAQLVRDSDPYLACPCGNALWSFIYRFLNSNRVSIKCINCQHNLTRGELEKYMGEIARYQAEMKDYDAEIRKRAAGLAVRQVPVTVNADPMYDADADLDLSEKLEKTLRSPDAIETEFSTRLDALYFLFREALAGGKQ